MFPTLDTRPKTAVVIFNSAPLNFSTYHSFLYVQDAELDSIKDDDPEFWTVTKEEFEDPTGTPLPSLRIKPS